MSASEHEEFDGVPELYVLDAVPPDERAGFERHLDTCDQCRADVDSFRSTVEAMGGPATTMPPGLRASVLAAVDEEASRVIRLTRRRRIMWLAAACAMVVALAAGFTVWRSANPTPAPNIAQSAVVSSVMSAPDMTKASASMVNGTVAAMYAPSQRATVVATADLPPIAPDMMYQVWITVGGAVKSAGMVPGGQADKSMVVMTDMERPTMVGLSVEPATGSVQPTSPMVVRFPIT